MKNKKRLLDVKDFNFPLTINSLSYNDLQENMLELKKKKNKFTKKQFHYKKISRLSNKQFVGKYAVLWTVYSEAKFFRYRPKNEFRKIHSKGF